eukprot:scaffold643474_cov153-Attheya_sp.AAC.1
MAGVRRGKRQSHYPMRTTIFLVIEWVVPIAPLDDVDRKHFEWLFDVNRLVSFRLTNLGLLHVEIRLISPYSVLRHTNGRSFLVDDLLEDDD